MAVASFNPDGEAPVIRGFDPPKTASVSHWYRAAVAMIRDAPSWRDIPHVISAADVSEDTIIFHGDDWSLYIARKRFLK